MKLVSRLHIFITSCWSTLKKSVTNRHNSLSCVMLSIIWWILINSQKTWEKVNARPRLSLFVLSVFFQHAVTAGEIYGAYTLGKGRFNLTPSCGDKIFLLSCFCWKCHLFARIEGSLGRGQIGLGRAKLIKIELWFLKAHQVSSSHDLATHISLISFPEGPLVFILCPEIFKFGINYTMAG